MDNETLKALKKSIRKWEVDIPNGHEDEGWTDCALCEIFWNDDCWDSCEDCPVMEKTGRIGCNGSPYEKWGHHQKNEHPNLPDIIHCNTCKELAAKEAEFLRGLLPEGEEA